MREVLLVAIGGMCGAVARYGVGQAFPITPGKPFPVATLLVNLVGCFLIGLAGQYVLRIAADASVKPTADQTLWITTVRQGLIVGVLGGFTTFSAFGWDTVRLMQENHSLLALANIAANVLVGLLAVWAGMVLVRVWQ